MSPDTTGTKAIAVDLVASGRGEDVLGSDAHHTASRTALLTALGFLADRVVGLDDEDLTVLSRRTGWTTTELLVAAQLDLQRLLRNLMMTSSVEVAHDGRRCPYGPSETGHRLRTPHAHQAFVQIVASAYTSPDVLRAELAVTVDAVCLAASELDAGSLMAEETRVCTADFLQAWSQVFASYLNDLPAPGQ